MARLLVGCLLVALLATETEAVLGKRPYDWNREAYVVKVFARDSNLDVVHTCSGSLIAGSLVLTTADCVSHNERKMTEAAVFVHRPPSANRTVGVDRYPAEILEMFGDLALVRIKRIDPRKLCPRSGAKRVVRLPIRLSLTEPSILSINPDDVKKSKCYLAGFQSSPNVKDFAKENQVVKIPIEFTNVDGETLNAQVQNNLTACWEDAGLPVLCELSKPLGLTQVGVLRHLVAPENPESQKRFKRAKDTKDKEDEKETTTTASPTRNKGKSSKGSNKDDDEQATTPHAVTKKFEETSAEKSKVEKDDKKNKKTNKKQPSQKAEKKANEDRDDEDDEKPKLDILFGEMCSNVEEMVFVPLFQPEQLAKLIQKYDLPSFADVYQHCDFS